MAQIFLSYARKDGFEAATRLRFELERADFQIWRDREDMRGGQDWRQQLQDAIYKVDVVLVLLTPAAVQSPYVTEEWKLALRLGKVVIPLLIRDCTIPRKLSRLHYHNLSGETEYTLGFAALIRDLNHLPESTQTGLSSPLATVLKFLAIAGNTAMGLGVAIGILLFQPMPNPEPQMKPSSNPTPNQERRSDAAEGNPMVIDAASIRPERG